MYFLFSSSIVIVQDGNCQTGSAVFTSNYLGNTNQAWILNDDGTISPQCNLTLAMYVATNRNNNILLGYINDNETRTEFQFSSPFFN